VRHPNQEHWRRCGYDALHYALGRGRLRRDENRNVGLGPEHDWSSHAADAFGYMAVAYEEPAARKSSTDWRLDQKPRGSHWSA
jgi:phage terminase large subunit